MAMFVVEPIVFALGASNGSGILASCCGEGEGIQKGEKRLANICVSLLAIGAMSRACRTTIATCQEKTYTIAPYCNLSLIHI